MRVAAPNLAAGNTVIAKPAPSVPASSLAFERLLHDAGAPSGVYQTVFASNEQAGRIVADPRVRGVALTGSERAGSAVAAEAGKALKKCTMELGGSNAFIIRDDADLDHAVKLAVQGRLMNTGQACAASKRFIVHEHVFDLFTRRFGAAMDSLVSGDPLDERTTLGLLVNETAVKTILDQINRAIAGGAQVVTGGQRLDRPGCFIAATILEMQPDNPVAQEELFAPVAMVFRVRDDAEAIRLANATPFGLGASIITRDAERARALADQIDAGMVFINSNVLSAPELPFGGVKNSGFGRELSDLGIGEFVNRKLVTISDRKSRHARTEWFRSVSPRRSRRCKSLLPTHGSRRPGRTAARLPGNIFRLAPRHAWAGRALHGDRSRPAWLRRVRPARPRL